MPRTRTGLTGERLDVAALIQEISAPDIGGIGVFIGTVRSTPAVDGRQNQEVVALEYEAHPELAPRRLEDIAVDAAERWDLVALTAVHREGRCPLGEPTVVVVCGAAHRAEALEACRYVIDELKATVPIFKREVYSDGSSWVGAEAAS